MTIRLVIGFGLNIPVVPARFLRQGHAQRKKLAGMFLRKLALYILRLLAAQPAPQANAVTFICKGNLQVVMQAAVTHGFLIGPLPLLFITVFPA